MSNNNTERKVAFEYFIHKIWNKSNNLDLIKSLKLLFFTVATTATQEKMGLLDVFTDFYAMPYGHVEGYIYNSLKENSFDTIKLIDNKMQLTGNIEDIKICDKLKTQIENAIKTLSRVNPYIFYYDSFELVDLSHEWESWEKNYNLARENKKYAKRIPTTEIAEDTKKFVL